ncbi:YdeI family protein [Microbacterium fluvii]|uniref:YdeI family protein n=1 Tax=Microbacterium fluvii TaxID=415215 RepID=A0ABW2HFQ1_9MICO|nr:YdeI/OmpD-associated family protein [Microbacterium fluvii]MCU4673341.1 YdeI/OmpD-associated family protein [Microbacterium fluvii]
MTQGSSGDSPAAVFFASAGEFRAWLERNHATATEVWTGFYRVGDPRRGLTWEDAVLEALCFGWIDSTSRRIDDDARAQRWSPRKPASNWSEINIAHVERLRAEGRMHPAGLAAYERRRADRIGVYSHEQRNELTVDELAVISASPAAAAFWQAATPGYRRAVANWVQSAKREQTRADRLATLVADSAAGRLVPFQRYGEPPAWLARAAAAAAAAAAG